MKIWEKIKNKFIREVLIECIKNVPNVEIMKNVPNVGSIHCIVIRIKNTF